MPVKSKCRLVDQVSHREVHAELALEQLRRQEPAVVVDGSAILLEPQPPLLRLGGIRLLRSPHELELVDLLDVDAEAGEPGVRARRGRVHPHRASADASEGRPAKPADRARRCDLHLEAVAHVGVSDVSPHARISPPHLVEPAGCCEHRNETRPRGIEVRHEDQR